MLINIPRLLSASNDVAIAIAIIAAVGIVALVYSRRSRMLAKPAGDSEEQKAEQAQNEEEKVTVPAYSRHSAG